MLGRKNQTGIIMHAVSRGIDQSTGTSNLDMPATECVQSAIAGFGFSEDRVSIGEFNRMSAKVAEIRNILDES